MTSHEMMAIQICMLGTLAGVLVVLALVRLFRWSDRRFEEQLEAEFRAHILLSESKRQARRDFEAEQVNLRG